MKTNVTTSSEIMPETFLDFDESVSLNDSLINFTRCGPAIQDAIAAVNKAVIELFITAGLLGDSEPLATILLGVPRDILDELACSSSSALLAANAYGLPLVELRIKDPAVLRRVIQGGFGSTDAVAEITKTLPLEFITRAKRRF